MADERHITILQGQIEALRRDADKATGVVEQTLAQLKNDFGCESLKEAEQKLTEMDQAASKASAKFDRAYKEFMDLHGAELGSF